MPTRPSARATTSPQRRRPGATTSRASRRTTWRGGRCSTCATGGASSTCGQASGTQGARWTGPRQSTAPCHPIRRRCRRERRRLSCRRRLLAATNWRGGSSCATGAPPSTAGSCRPPMLRASGTTRTLRRGRPSVWRRRRARPCAASRTSSSTASRRRPRRPRRRPRRRPQVRVGRSPPSRPRSASTPLLPQRRGASSRRARWRRSRSGSSSSWLSL
mmetsp:Transcript_46460/g.149589  ORF Transcript_46460/g.149589 Transcript_46460/m.149589 type:complete len:217 (+) Transcript_46460:175-825(+)